MVDKHEGTVAKDIAIISIIQLTITTISSLFANYLLTSVSFVSSPTLSFKIFVVVYSILSLCILMSKTKTRWSLVQLAKLPFIVGSCTLIFYVIAVLYGAPFLSKTDETMMLGLVMAVLCFLPPCCILGANLDVLYRIFISNWLECTAESYFQCCMTLTVFGAWLGAFPIPLDWDRPWQVWPIPCVIGGMLGNTLGVFISGIIFYCTSKTGRKDL
ncbi:phosphatidylinositol-glycan biosynthesis class F protein-like [Actinia tenebrosa]|uniref:Phosphatidylinositol-glycan biosynthesis class F protein-like n=1 Tax=Actinia tenebrosa TaxID=6105 RepID=A0A6P8H8L0_ACTTE|nr:phosphatidylinositol-glycan biosynthesis class F protein-like [Actinia tenebrosa]